MNLAVQFLDKLIAAAEAIDHELHAKLDYLKGLREKLSTFGAADDDEADPLVGSLREFGNSLE